MRGPGWSENCSLSEQIRTIPEAPLKAPDQSPARLSEGVVQGGQDLRGHARCIQAKLREDGGGLAVGDVRRWDAEDLDRPAPAVRLGLGEAVGNEGAR